MNATGTLVLLSEARRAGVQRFLHVSSSEVYGTARHVPMDEDHPTRPETVYGASKLAGEGSAGLLSHVRLPHARRPSVQQFWTAQPLRRGCRRGHSSVHCLVLNGRASHFRRWNPDGDFLYVEDTAYWLIRAAECDQLVGQTINLGSGEETSIATLAEIVYDEVAKTRILPDFQPRRPGDVQRHRADVWLRASGSASGPGFRWPRGFLEQPALFRRSPNTPPPCSIRYRLSTGQLPSRRERPGRPFAPSRDRPPFRSRFRSSAPKRRRALRRWSAQAG